MMTSRENYEAMLLEDLKEGPIHFTDKRAVGRRIAILNNMRDRGLIDMELIEVDEQESYLEVRMKSDA